jgi:hypothetical protein
MFVLAQPENSEGLPMTVLAKKAKISVPVMTQGMGTIDPDCRKGHDDRYGYRCLLSLGYVKVQVVDFGGKGGSDTCFALTALGRKKWESLGLEFKLDKAHPAPYSINEKKVSKKKKAS